MGGQCVVSLVARSCLASVIRFRNLAIENGGGVDSCASVVGHFLDQPRRGALCADPASSSRHYSACGRHEIIGQNAKWGRIDDQKRNEMRA